MAERLRILLLCAHPVQYASPVFRRMAQHPSLDVTVAYCSLQGAERALDPDFGIEVAWDIPLLEGYRWVQLPNHAFSRSEQSFLGLMNPSVWKLIRKGKFDAAAIFTGYKPVTFWIAALAAKFSGSVLMFGTDSHNLNSRDGRNWKQFIKKMFWPRLFGMADLAIAPSSGTVALMHSLGLPDERIAMLPYVVDNERWIAEAKKVDRSAIRRAWNIPEDAPVVLFCAKLQPWKRPQDLLRAFAKANVPGAYLVYAGEGSIRRELEDEARALGVDDRTRFLGFANQGALPGIYTACNLLVLPSEYEPFGLVVNEAMLCGRGVIVSDRVGAKYDLVREGETGFVFLCGDIDALAALLTKTLGSPELLCKLGEAARKRMGTWGPNAYIEAFISAVERAKRLRAPRAAK
ncbi:MAG TPA: glycosyltransferase family 4 protein [Candidatus Acidoferrales bacterium]|nr:glycosyltransferase family 4 protein [Candidatus Acidoferrales bacterium]